MGDYAKFEDDPGYIYLEVTREAKAKALARPYDSKKNCWVPDPEEGRRTYLNKSDPFRFHCRRD
jgi:hypothetical protein